MKAAERLARTIARQLLDGEFEPGESLSTEADMAAAYGVGRSTVREALRLLEIWGLVEMRQGRHGGPVAQKPDSRALGDHLGIVMQFEGVTLEDLFETQRVLDTLMVGLATRQMTDEEVLELGQAVHGLGETIDDIDAYYVHNDRFYEILAASSRNRALQVLMSTFKSVTTELMYRTDNPREWREISIPLRQAVFRAVASGDPVEAEARMAEYRTVLHKWWKEHDPDLVDARIDVLDAETESPGRRRS